MLWKKMFRDLKENRGAYFACSIIMIIGLLVFTTFSMVLDNLKLSQSSFYTNQNFADGFAKVKAIPFNEVQKLASIKGISKIEGRMIQDVQVLLPDRQENVYLRLISIDPQQENPINGVLLSQGIPLKAKELNIWIDNKFYEANNLSLNEGIEIIASGKKRTLNIVGIGISPEFIYALRTSADIYPSPETFGIAFIPKDVMETFFAQQRTYNDLVFTLEPGVNYDDVKDILEYELKPYGLTSLIPRADQVSHLLLTEELKGLETMAKNMPIMFLAIGAMILYIILKRMVEQQRGQIGILKAFGYTHHEILLHYLSYPVTIALVGSIIGGILGIVLSYPFTAFYELFFNMPDLLGKFSPLYLISGILLSLLFSLFAGYQGCKKILTLEPAEAMRAPAPPHGKKTWIEKISFVWNMLTVQGMMAVRNLSRNKGRSSFIFIGIMFCFAISVFTWSMNDMVQKMLFDQYEKVEVYDVKVSLARPQAPTNVSRELMGFSGVHKVEPLAEIPVTLKNEWYKKDVVLIGVPEEGELYNILDKNYTRLKPPKEGLLLSERLALVLNAQIGTKLKLETLLLNENMKDRELEVVGIIPQYLGVNAYMEINALQNFLRQEALATSFMLNMNKENIAPLQEKYRQSDAVVSIEAKGERLRKLQEMMASYGSLIYVYALIGVIIGFAIIYSSSIITLSERSRELASMLVLGMTPAEVLSVVTFEQWCIGILAMITGIPLAKLMLTGLSQTFSNDLYTMPTTMTFSSFLLAFIVTAASIWVAQRIASRKIKNLSLVEVLKSGE